MGKRESIIEAMVVMVKNFHWNTQDYTIATTSKRDAVKAANAIRNEGYIVSLKEDNGYFHIKINKA